MTNHIAKRTVAALTAASAITLASAEIPLHYYSSLQGLAGAELKNAIHSLVSENVSMLTYGSGTNYTWWGFYVTDRDPETNQVIDRYSNDTFYFGDRGSSVSGMNIEHSFPKSWWGGTTNNAYKDLFNLMPCEAKINSSKSNFPMGTVINATTDNGCTKVGPGSNGYKLWEPADRWKGDFARGYMYMATAYQDFTWTGTEALEILEQNTYPTLQQWASSLYLAWARADAVTEKEFSRNNTVQAIQGNRNPYVDFPNLMEYVWGDSTDVAIDLFTTVKGGPFYGTLLDPSESPVSVFESTFLDDPAGCTISYTLKPSGYTREVWYNDPQYGWVAKASTGSSAYNNLKCFPADATLLTPEIDLTSYAVASFTFDHACNYAASPASVLSVGIMESGNSTASPVEIAKWPTGKSWTFVNAGNIDISRYAGKKIRIAFRYTSTADEASQWEIKNLSLSARGKFSGIDNIPVYLQPEADCATMPVEYFSLDGRRVDPATYRGIAIRRQGTRATKVVLR